MDNKEKLLDTLQLWQAYGIQDDIFWREDFKSLIKEIRNKYPEYSNEQIIQQLEKDLQQ